MHEEVPPTNCFEMAIVTHVSGMTRTYIDTWPIIIIFIVITLAIRQGAA